MLWLASKVSKLQGNLSKYTKNEKNFGVSCRFVMVRLELISIDFFITGFFQKTLMQCCSVNNGPSMQRVVVPPGGLKKGKNKGDIRTV